MIPDELNTPQANTPPPAAPVPAKKAKKWWLWMSIPILSIIGLFALYSWLVVSVISFSEGERAGYLHKLSKKGWLCKTWEGEMAITSIPGSAPEKFLFTVRDDAIAQKINAQMGNRVALVYSQHKGIPSSCFGDTEYFIHDVIVR